MPPSASDAIADRDGRVHPLKERVNRGNERRGGDEDGNNRRRTRRGPAAQFDEDDERERDQQEGCGLPGERLAGDGDLLQAREGSCSTSAAVMAIAGEQRDHGIEGHRVPQVIEGVVVAAAERGPEGVGRSDREQADGDDADARVAGEFRRGSVDGHARECGLDDGILAEHLPGHPGPPPSSVVAVANTATSNGSPMTALWGIVGIGPPASGCSTRYR